MCASDVISYCWIMLKPLLICLKWLLVVFFGLLLLPLILALAGLFLSLRAMGVDVNSEWPIVLITIICVIALIWFICHYCAGIIELDGRDHWDALKSDFSTMVPDENRDLAASLATVVNHVESIAIEIMIPQMIVLGFLLLAFFLLIQIWFIPYIGEFLFGLILGAIAVATVSYYSVRYTIRALAKTLVYAEPQDDSALSHVLGVGYSLTFFVVCIVYSFFLICYFITRFFLIEKLDKEGLKRLNLMLMGFLMGMILGGFIYRETSSIISRVLKTATLGLVKTESSLHLQNEYLSIVTKLSYMIQAQLGQILVNFLDALILMITFTCATYALFYHSTEMIEGGNKSIMAPFLYFITTSFGTIISAIFGYLCKKLIKEEEVSSFTATTCRISMIIAGTFAIMIYCAMPFITIPADGFSLSGQGTNIINKDKITRNGVMWCCILGIFTNLWIIAIFEWFTSHGCPPVRNMSLASVNRILGMNIIYSNYLGGVAGCIPIFTFLLMIFIVYSIASFAGLIFFTAGYMSMLFVSMAIYFAGASSSDSYKLTNFVNFSADVQDKISRISWASRNYMIYLKVTNAGAMILLCLVFVGCLMFSVGNEANLFHGPLGFIGILLGSGLSFMIKGINTCQVINLAKIYDIGQESLPINEDFRVYEYVRQKFFQSLSYILPTLLLVTIITFLNSGLFGIESAIGLVLGFSIGSFLIMMNSLIQGTSLENARIFNESNDELNKQDRIYASYVSGDVIGTAVEESNAVPIYLYLIYLATLTYCCSESMNHAGLIPELIAGTE